MTFSIDREVLQEDATGSLTASVQDVVLSIKRRRLLDRKPNLRLGMVSEGRFFPWRKPIFFHSFFLLARCAIYFSSWTCQTL
jgi:hypothetical protein